ncbi:MAG: alpha/beta hydrolase [Planctomycetes bacterium]|nr:alpha/beta hydrolase [Planctomycetota bacterium]
MRRRLRDCRVSMSVNRAFPILAGLSFLMGGCAGKEGLVREEVRIQSVKGILAGVLELPPGPGPHPAILIVPGSGPATREFPLYAALAEHWLSRGIAVLRYDKRGTGGSAGDWSSETFQERADDVVALAAYLRDRADIRSDRVGLCGHSQGGWIAPLAAASAPREIAFLVILAGAAMTPAEQDLSSTRHRLLQAGFAESAAEEAVSLKRALHDLARHGRAEEAEVSRLLEAASGHTWFSSVFPPNLKVAELCGLMRYLGLIMDHDPLPVLQRVSCPVLAVFGGKDPFVDPLENSAPMEQALRQGSHDVTIRIVPTAGHRLEPAGEGGRGFAEGALEGIDDWLEPRTTR